MIMLNDIRHIHIATDILRKKLKTGYFDLVSLTVCFILTAAQGLELSVKVI